MWTYCAEDGGGSSAVEVLGNRCDVLDIRAAVFLEGTIDCEAGVLALGANCITDASIGYVNRRSIETYLARDPFCRTRT